MKHLHLRKRGKKLLGYLLSDLSVSMGLLPFLKERITKHTELYRNWHKTQYWITKERACQTNLLSSSDKITKLADRETEEIQPV